MCKTEPTPRLPWIQRICYGVGHSLNDLLASMWFSYLIVYLQLVLGFRSNYAGLVLLVGQATNAISTPLLGYESSNNRETSICKKYGKKKFLHLIGTIVVVLSFPFIFCLIPGLEKSSELAFTVMLIPLVIFYQVGWSAVQVAHLSLLPTITPHRKERDFLNVLRYAVDILSDIVTYVTVWCVFDLTRESALDDNHTIKGNYATKFTMITVIIVSVGSLFSFIFHIGVKEVVDSPLSSPESSLDKDIVLLSDPPFPIFSNNLSWRGWLRESHFYQVGLLYMSSRLFQSMSLVFMPLYLQESLHARDDFVAKIPLVMNVSGFVVSCCLPKLFLVFSKKVTFLAGASMGIGGCLCIAICSGPAYVTQGVYGVGVLIGAASTSLVICSLSFIHDLIGTSVESAAFVYGVMSFGDKMMSGIVGMIIQYLHAMICKDCDWFYKYVMSYGLGGVGILACIFITTLLPVNLGERQSSYNVLQPKKEVVNDSSSGESNGNEKMPLLPK